MRETLYEMIYKRKSFHVFRDLGEERISAQELEDIKEAYKAFPALYPEIKTALRIVAAKESGCDRGEEYCIYFYSEIKDNYLQNIGYLGEQLDLYLVSRNIGTLWFGIGKPEEKTYEGLNFVIMMAISKVSDETKFRKDMFKSKRKDLEEMWKGPYIEGVSNIVRFAPSACNTQPWLVKNEDDGLYVYRYKKEGKRGIMPADKVSYYNRIDMGIFLCLLEICFYQEDISWERELFIDEGKDEELSLNAKYQCKRSIAGNDGVDLTQYEGKPVRLSDLYGTVLEGIAVYNSIEYNYHEYGVEEDGLQIANHLIYRSQIKEIEDLEFHIGPYGHFTCPYGELEEWNYKEGISFIDDILTSDYDEHILRMYACLEDHFDQKRGFEGFTCTELMKVLKDVLKLNDNEDVQRKTRSFMEMISPMMEKEKAE